MKSQFKRSTVAVVLLSPLLAACGQATDSQDAAPTPASSRAETSDAAPSANALPKNLVVVSALYGVGADTLKELKDFGPVIVGTVTQESDGQNASATDPYPHDHQVRRVLTIRVDRVLSGDEGLKEFTVNTLGWQVGEDGVRTPTVSEGKPWLQVGDQVFFVAKQDPRDGTYYSPGSDGAFIIRDGKLQSPPGDGVSPILERLRGLSLDEIEKALLAAG